MGASTLLNMLADGEFRSGQDLADALGVSRTAVWKQVNKFASELGLEIESVKGRGYRIPGGVDLLDEQAIRAGLTQRSAALLRALDVAEILDSTNAQALRDAERGDRRGHVYTAEQQTAGRGRRGREWVSPYAGNIYLSLSWQYEQGAAVLEGLSLAVGVAVTRALDACGVQGMRLKWPNDILYDGAKLGGILIEMSGDAAGPCQVVVGVGLNVAMPRGAAAAIDQAWTDLAAVTPGQAPGRNRLVAALLDELLPLLADFEEGGFGPWRDAWQALDAYAGQSVVLDTGSRRLAGVARGVDERGALLLETTSGVQPVYGGEISMRPAQ
ncbi:MAG: bifunctional biotin--[acetyl-CoA-carboxylase] ligase/biotin operon repressor BirA [Halioglobus sp.]|nr:bifunctional biotin--[acetyl-CoA-carboxylase] ligase/biotin operon repressor BirA [Halioglobus sp.]